MKKILALIFLSTIFLASTVFSAQAAYDFTKNSGVDIGAKVGYDINTVNSPEYYVGMILGIAFSLLGLIFLIITIYAGIKWMTAQGNTSQIEQAKNTLVKAVVGLIICLLAYGITYFVINIFQGSGLK